MIGSSAIGTPAQRALVASFLRFGVVGASGFLVDTAVVYATKGALGLNGAGIPAYIAAATWTWAFNRWWTFRGQGSGPMWRQWLRAEPGRVFFVDSVQPDLPRLPRHRGRRGRSRRHVRQLRRLAPPGLQVITPAGRW
jgi:hypothetical protein